MSTCECGCGRAPKGDTSRFLPGHANSRRARPSLRERMLGRLIIDPSGCLLWPGSRTAHGYGTIGVGAIGQRMRYVHRLMYEMFVGPIPDGLTIDHLCRVRHCAAPSHLEAVTAAENYQRGVEFRRAELRVPRA